MHSVGEWCSFELQKCIYIIMWVLTPTSFLNLSRKIIISVLWYLQEKIIKPLLVSKNPCPWISLVYIILIQSRTFALPSVGMIYAKQQGILDGLGEGSCNLIPWLGPLTYPCTHS